MADNGAVCAEGEKGVVRTLRKNLHRLHARQLKFGDYATDAAVQAVAYIAIDQYPNAGLKELCQRIRDETQLPVTVTWLQRTIASWGWTWRLPRWVMTNKYSDANIDYWAQFAAHITRVPWERVSNISRISSEHFSRHAPRALQLKYIDESKFVAKNVRRMRRVGPRGRELRVIDDPPRGGSYSMTLLTSVEHTAAPLFYTLTQQNNDAWAFFLFLLQAVHAQYIGPGDFVVVDNARIHTAAATLHHTDALLATVGAHIVFLPTYSPEFNPCEQVFSWVKRNLRMHYSRESLPDRIRASMAQLPAAHVAKFYLMCTDIAIRRLAQGH